MKLKYDHEKRHLDHPDHFDNWLIVHAATTIQEAGGKVEGAELDLTLTGNGVEIDVLEFFRLIASRYEDEINREACKLVKDRCEDLLRAVFHLTDCVEDKTCELFPNEHSKE
jgi:hypothetical protein